MAQTEQQNIIKGIISTRCRDGATISDIIDDYKELIGANDPLTGKSLKDINDYLNSIEGVYSVLNPGGFSKWYVDSEDSAHVTSMILSQKPFHPKLIKLNGSMKMTNMEVPQNNSISGCFFRDNYIYKSKQVYRQHNPREETSNNWKTAAFGGAQFIGDDFFLSMIANGVDFQIPPQNSKEQCYRCLPGLDIKGATDLLKNIEIDHLNVPTVLINVGSIDILKGIELVEMCMKYEKLISVCQQRNIRPIITTLAPLAHVDSMNQLKLMQFNNFLLDQYFLQYLIIDIWSKMVTPCGYIKFDYYDEESKSVSDTNESCMFWNPMGCQHILELIKRHL